MGPGKNVQRVKIFQFTLLLISLWSTATMAAADGAGTTALPFLAIGTSARGEAMGGAFVAVVNDVDAGGYNPAGLAQLHRSSLAFTHLEWFEGIHYEYLSFADKWDYIGAVGANIGYLSMADIPGTVENPLGGYTGQGTFKVSDLLINLDWAGNLFYRENKVGLALKIAQETLADSQSVGAALDFGDQILLSHYSWYRKAQEEHWWAYLLPSTIGVSLRNLGVGVKYSFQNDPLPMTTDLGVAYKVLNDNLTCALDVQYRLVEKLSAVQAGAEYWLHTGWGGGEQPLEIALRAGYRSGYSANSAPGVSFGAGVVFSSLGLDYVFMPFGDLGSANWIELKYSWGPVLKDKILVKHKRLVKRDEGGEPESALQQTASEMVKSRKSMEESVVVRKTTVKGPAVETDSQHAAEVKNPGSPATANPGDTVNAAGVLPPAAHAQAPAYVSPPQPPVSGPAKLPDMERTGSNFNNSSLIAEITRGAKEPSAGRTQSHYLRRTPEDAVRAAKHDADQKSRAFSEVEKTAKEEARQTGEELSQSLTKVLVYFPKDSDTLQDKYLKTIDQIAAAYDQNPQSMILIQGYTAGDERDISALSLRRAMTVKDYLVQIKSVPKEKITLKGLGDKDPVAGSDTEKDRAQNRRVLVQIIRAGN